MSDLEQILKDRGEQYGEFEDHACITQNLKRNIQDAPNWQSHKLTVFHKEALEMISHKIGRILNGNPNNIDSWADIAGYAQLVVNILKKENKK